MSQPPNLDLLSTEDRVILAIQAIRSDSSLTQRRAAHVFSGHESTLRNRRAGKASRRDSHPNSSRLKRDEEKEIVQYIKKLDARGFAPTLSYVREMANQLLAARSGGLVGENWAYRLVRRRPEIKSQITRQRDHQRVLYSNPAIISPWFNLVRNVKAKYGILDEDTYNFDETGFQIGVGGSVKVVTASERRSRPLGVQPGDREWVTLIAGINAMGWSIPPFLDLKAKHHDQAWYHNNPKDWRIGVSNNGWTTNELGLAWLQHFIQHTKARTVGNHQLLILDGHESHQSLAFQDLCEENKIITVCMPPRSSHILQPLDVGCFAPLKQAYKKELRGLADSHIHHIDKKAFLATIGPVFDKAFSRDNIVSSFRATGLVPYNPEVVLSKLEVKPRTPTPPAQGPTPWQPRTPSKRLGD
ncbi:putative transposase [Alternaria alternata]|nr:putative transposase [Alternaria alternata]